MIEGTGSTDDRNNGQPRLNQASQVAKAAVLRTERAAATKKRARTIETPPNEQKSPFIRAMTAESSVIWSTPTARAHSNVLAEPPRTRKKMLPRKASCGQKEIASSRPGQAVPQSHQ
jgi:hypothetical protein